MAGGYKPVLTGAEGLAAEFRDLNKRLDDLRKSITGLGIQVDGATSDLVFDGDKGKLRIEGTGGQLITGGGGLTIEDDGVITLVPSDADDAVKMELLLDSGDEAGTVEWVTNGQPTAPAHVRGYSTTDNNVGIEITTADVDTDGTADAEVSVDPYAGVSMRHGFPIGTEAHAGVTAARGTLSGIPYGQVVIDANDGTNGGSWVFDSGTASTTSTLSGPNTALWAAPTSAVEWRAQQNSGGALVYIPVLASAFTVSSSRAVKEDIAEIPFDALAAVQAAPARIWRYRADHATENVEHIGPMAEDLPPVMVHEADGVKSVDLLTLVGVLWDAVGTLTTQLESLRGSRDE